MRPERPPAADDAELPHPPDEAGEPEGGERPRPSQRRFGELPIALVLMGVALGLGVVALNHFKRGSVLVAAAVLLGAVLRLLLPERQAGLLAVRSRTVDVLVLGCLGLGLAAVTVVAPSPP